MVKSPKDEDVLRDRLSTFVSKDNSGNHKRKCTKCKVEINGEPTRIFQHVGGCTDAQGKKSIRPCAQKAAFDVADVEQCQVIMKKRQEVAAAAKSASEAVKQRDVAAGFKQGGIRAHLKGGVGSKRRADDSVANWLYEKDMPPNTVSSEAWKEMMLEVSAHGPGYVSPGRKQLLGVLLDNSQDQMNEMLRPCIRQEKVTGSCLETDGMTNVKQIPVINFMVSSPAGGRFLKLYDTTGKVIDE